MSKPFNFFSGVIICCFFLFPEILWALTPGSNSSREVLWQGIGFVLLLILLSRFLKKPIQDSLAKRKKEIQIVFEQAAIKIKEAEAQIAEWERKLNSISQEIADLHQKLIKEGEADRERIIARAQEEAARIKEQAQIVAEQEVKKARLALHKETVDLAINLAQELLKEVTRPRDQEQLVRDFISKIGANA